VETLILSSGRVLISWVKVLQASATDKPARKRALVGVDEACYSSYAGEVTIDNPFLDLPERLEENNNTRAGGRVVARLARLVQNNSVCSFQ